MEEVTPERSQRASGGSRAEWVGNSTAGRGNSTGKGMEGREDMAGVAHWSGKREGRILQSPGRRRRHWWWWWWGTLGWRAGEEASHREGKGCSVAGGGCATPGRGFLLSEPQSSHLESG